MEILKPYKNDFKDQVDYRDQRELYSIRHDYSVLKKHCERQQAKIDSLTEQMRVLEEALKDYALPDCGMSGQVRVKDGVLARAALSKLKELRGQ